METSGITWVAPPADLELPTRAIHVWRAALDEADSPGPGIVRLLSTAERGRARGYRFEIDRRRFVHSHAILRLIVGMYLGAPPDALSFGRGAGGKPRLVGRNAASGLRFNMSHSRGLGLYAFSCDREIGIDVEHVDPVPVDREIAERLRVPDEVREIRRVAEKEKERAFCAAWTRKQARAKAGGTRADGSVDPQLGPRLQSRRDGPGARERHRSARWSVATFEPAPGFVASLATQTEGLDVKYFIFRPQLLLARAE
ncbi:MAG: 4'-phosphopantetheinyl transferase superfamily protein [Chloroflexi bacterium]|nr:4'-phosphopantetheinyl transferase superfamily protein [Chloroflexota bacterium]